MTEAFLHYLWKFQLFNKNNLQTTSGENITVLKTGEFNTDAGPDLFNAKIKVGNTIWAGNVEIHLKSSDWENHTHQKDKSYDNVILHVVHEADKTTQRKNGDTIPCVELKDRIDKKIYGNYLQLIQSKQWIPCQNQIHTVDKFTIRNWIERLLIERLETKTAAIERTLILNNNNWEETFYQFLARNFGLKINAEPFEQLAKSLPLKILAKHKNNLLQIEALLFGQAGFLNPHPYPPDKRIGTGLPKGEGEKFKDDYPQQLQKEYSFLQKKYSLTPISKHLWKFLRLMPANFPTIRIAQFAQLVFQSSHLFSKILERKNVAEIEKLFEVGTSPYWKTHYRFEKPSATREKHFGKDAIQLLLINTIAPFLFVYGKMKGNEMFKEKAFQLLENISPEKNNIIKRWESLNIKTESAYQTQALLQLKKEYCDKKKCLQCAIGNKILTR